MALLRAESLTKDYGSFRALEQFTLSVAPGEVVGLLGPNGSGKTTALRMILGFIRPTSGTASIGGHDCWNDSVAARRLVTYLPGELRLYENMTGRQLVGFLSRLRGYDPGDELDRLARKLDIDPDRPLTQMSSGMKRKVALLAILLPPVPLVILDEPTNTLDPTMRDELLDQLRLAKAAGKAVLFSSHVMQEVEAVCDRVIILRKGHTVHRQELSDLREGRHVRARLLAPLPTTGPDGRPFTADELSPAGDLNIDYRGPIPQLLAWLAERPTEDLRIEPLGLTPIYKKYHGDLAE